MKRFGYAVVLAATLGCSTFSNITTPGGAINAASTVAANQSKCMPLKTEEVPQGEEIAVGGAVAVNWLKIGQGVYSAGLPDNEVTAYLNRVGKNLALHSSRPGLPWTFGAVESESVNAYSTPGGYVLVTKGLLKKVKSEAELAGILAHEIGHVTHKHALNQYRESKFWACTTGGLVQAGASAEGGPLGNVLASPELFGKIIDKMVDGLVNQGLAHDSEFDADAEALKLIIRAGYDPKPFLAFLGSLGGGGTFANHPPSAERVTRLQAQLDALKVDQPFLATFDAPKAVPLKGELATLK